jgi:hypothetical protein
MNDELEGTWEEAVVAQSKYYPSIYPQELEGTTKTAGVPAGIRTDNILNTRLTSMLTVRWIGVLIPPQNIKLGGQCPIGYP